MKSRKILAAALIACFVFALPVQAQNPWSTAAMQAWKQSITAAGYMGAPRYATASLPTCNAANQGALAYDTTLNSLYVCVPSTWTAAGGTGLSLNTAQTPDALYLATDALSNSFILAESADSAFDFAHAQATDPSLFIHSHNQNTTQWIGISHDGTNGVITTGTGALSLPVAVALPSSNLGLNVGSNSSVNAYIALHTNQTPDAPFLATGTTANYWIIAERGDMSTDFAHAQATNPSVYIQSADATQTAQFSTLSFTGVASNRRTVTVDSATTFALTSGYIDLQCTGAETINTITGAVTGTVLYLENTDSECTIADDDAPTASNAVNLAGSANDVGAAEKVLVLIYNGSSWYQLSESDN